MFDDHAVMKQIDDVMNKDGKPYFSAAQYYYDNGKIREERSYRLGLKEGTWKTYDIDGELVLTTTYQSGQVKKYEGVNVNEQPK